MERQIWIALRDLATEVCADIDHPGRQYSERWILLVYLWAVVNNRPVSWACRPAHWPADLRPINLPSQPTMSRRLRSPVFLWALALLLERLGAGPPAPRPSDPTTRADQHGLVKVLDGMPLRVGGMSKDRDARTGFGAGAWFRGYKLHALWGYGSAPLAWSVRPANVSESTVADGLLGRLEGFGYVLGDAIFDCNRLYEVAHTHGHQLIAPKKRKSEGLGHHRQSPARLHGLALLNDRYGKELYAERSLIERHFSDLANCQGISMLPSWVRTPHRVVIWVGAKLAVNAVRTILRQRLVA
jgi:hypothetical protein